MIEVEISCISCGRDVPVKVRFEDLRHFHTLDQKKGNYSSHSYVRTVFKRMRKIKKKDL